LVVRFFGKHGQFSPKVNKKGADGFEFEDSTIESYLDCVLPAGVGYAHGIQVLLTTHGPSKLNQTSIFLET